MAGKWSFFVDDQPWNRHRRLFMVMSGPSVGQRSYVKPITVEAVDGGLAYNTPTLQESSEDQADGVGDVTGFLQAALDAAWELGMRPKAYADHTNELKAVRYHLEDMRALAKVPERKP